MFKPVILACLLLGFLMLFGCLGRSTGSASLNPVSWNSGAINNSSTGGNGSIIYLPDPKSVHNYVINTTSGQTVTFTNSIVTNKSKTCSASFGGGQLGVVTTAANASKLLLTNLSNITLVVATGTAYRNATVPNIANVTIKTQNISSENVTVFLNGIKIGNLSGAVNSTTFNFSSYYLMNGFNQFNFTGGNATNITNLNVSYFNSSFNCSYSDTQNDNLYSVLYENTSAGGKMVISIVNTSIINSTTFNISIYGGDLNSTVNTGVTCIYVWMPIYGYYDTFSCAYSLPYNTANWTNITGLSTAIYSNVTTGNVTIYLVHETTGDLHNFGMAVDYAGLSAVYPTYGTSAMLANITMSGSIDCLNWNTLATITNLNSTFTSGTVNGTYGCIRFNVTSVAAMNSTDAIQIRYLGTG